MTHTLRTMVLLGSIMSAMAGCAAGAAPDLDVTLESQALDFNAGVRAESERKGTRIEVRIVGRHEAPPGVQDGSSSFTLGIDLDAARLAAMPRDTPLPIAGDARFPAPSDAAPNSIDEDAITFTPGAGHTIGVNRVWLTRSGFTWGVRTEPEDQHFEGTITLRDLGGDRLQAEVAVTSVGEIPMGPRGRENPEPNVRAVVRAQALVDPPR